MSNPLRSAFVPAVFLLAAACAARAQTAQTFTPKQIVKFAQGGDKQRAAFSKMPGAADIVKGQFGYGAADFDGDGAAELVVVSLECDAAGCPVAVLQNNGGGKVTPLLVQKIDGRLAITNEKVNGYNAIAAADPAGAIIQDPRTGKQIVYPLGPTAPGAAAAAPPAAATARVAPPASAPAAPAAAPTPPPAAAKPAAPAVSPLKGEFLPVCTAARCLNPRVSSKSGVGTANAAAAAKVTPEDAAQWCAVFNPGYKYCADDQVAQGGTAGGAKFRSTDFKASANCTAGTMTAVDGGNYKYAGTWPDGPGKGRAQFSRPPSPTVVRYEQKQESAAESIYQIALEGNYGESLAIQWEVLCAGAAPPAAN